MSRMKSYFVMMLCMTVFAGCGGASAPLDGLEAEALAQGVPVATTGMAPVAGQQATCAGPQHKTFNIDVIETEVDLGGGTRFMAWTYDGGIPGPTIEACEGDRVTLNITNSGTTAHGLDTHAFKIDAREYGPVNPGETLVIDSPVEVPGVFMYHCASGPVTDLHIKSGLHGAMIVYPRDVQFRPAREVVVVQSAVYGQPDASGLIPGTDPNLTLANSPTRMMFNGRLDHAGVAVDNGDLVRVYFVNVGPGVSAAHAIGSVLDTVYDGTEPMHNKQTYAVPPGSGAILEFEIPAAGLFLFVDHDRLAFLPLGFVLPFSAVPTT